MLRRQLSALVIMVMTATSFVGLTGTTALASSAVYQTVNPAPVARLQQLPQDQQTAQIRQLPQGQQAVQNQGTMVVVTLGDSRSVSGRWQQKLCQEMATNAGITCDLRNLAVGGTNCDYWVPRIGNILTTHNPDMLILACGTNNNANTATGREQLGAAWRTIVETTYVFRSNPRVIIVPVLIQYSDPIAAPSSLQWVITSEPLVNDTIYVNSLYYSPYGWFPAGFIDWQIIPNSPPYLSDPLHASPLGEDYYGKLAYMQMAPDIGWPSPAAPITCDLYGGRYPYGRFTGPGSTPCQQATP